MIGKVDDPGNCLICELCWAEFENWGVLEACDDCGRYVCPECRSASPWDETVVRCKECWGVHGDVTAKAGGTVDFTKENPKLRIPFKKLDVGARAPEKSYSEFEAGWDLFPLKEYQIPIGDIRAVRTGIAVAIPRGYAGRLAERSGLGSRGVAIRGLAQDSDIEFRGKEIDATYRGEIGVLVHNLSRETLRIRPVDKFAQLVIYPICVSPLVEVDELPDSPRGDRGFGSSDR